MIVIEDSYFDAYLLIGNSNISKIPKHKFAELTFENKVGLTLSKITEEALEDMQLSITKIIDPKIISKVSFFYHWTEVLFFSYLKKNGKDLGKEWGAKSYLNFFCLNEHFSNDYFVEQYLVTSKLLIKFFDEAATKKEAKEIHEPYSIIVGSFIKSKGLESDKKINFREVFSYQLKACFEFIG